MYYSGSRKLRKSNQRYFEGRRIQLAVCKLLPSADEETVSQLNDLIMAEKSRTENETLDRIHNFVERVPHPDPDTEINNTDDFKTGVRSASNQFLSYLSNLLRRFNGN
jgi:hypothetical protein